MVDLPHALGISSFRNFFKSYKSFFRKWHSKLKHNNSKAKDTNHVHANISNNINGPSKDGEELAKKEGSRATAAAAKRGGERFRYGGGSMRENNPTSLRHRSYDSGFSSSLSRNASARRSMDSISSSTLLSKSGSRRGTTPIMFSNSSGVLKPAPIEKQLECTLEELCFGCVKKIKVTTDILSNTGEGAKEEKETLAIKVKPEWKKGTKITFEGMGSERLGSYPADMSFVIAEKRHSYFKREGDDLELTLEIPLVKALTDCTISVPLLGGEAMSMEINDVVSPGYEKIIEAQGMPIPKEDEKRGNLKVRFLVQFPTELTHQQRSDVCQILEGCDYYS